ncbi:MAG: hypothetical protein AAGF95_21410 [Chloroflexota bacterium]
MHGLRIGMDGGWEGAGEGGMRRQVVRQDRREGGRAQDHVGRLLSHTGLLSHEYNTTTHACGEQLENATVAKPSHGRMTPGSESGDVVQKREVQPGTAGADHQRCQRPASIVRRSSSSSGVNYDYVSYHAGSVG